MNREIKFRGKQYGEWVYGSLISLDSKMNQIYLLQFMDYASSLPLSQLIHHNMIIVEPKTIGQFVGLKDKNEKDIYEGDIVEIKNSSRLTKGYVDFPEGYKGKCISEVKIIEGHTYVWINSIIKGNILRFGARLLFEGLSKHIDMRGVATSDLKIIGNIHDNPELINHE